MSMPRVKEAGRPGLETTPMKSLNSSFDMRAYSGTKKKEIAFDDLENGLFEGEGGEIGRQTSNGMYQSRSPRHEHRSPKNRSPGYES